MATAVESLQQGQRVRVDAPGVPDFATVRFVTPADADGVAAVFLADDRGAVHEVRVGLASRQRPCARLRRLR